MVTDCDAYSLQRPVQETRRRHLQLLLRTDQHRLQNSRPPTRPGHLVQVADGAAPGPPDGAVGFRFSLTRLRWQSGRRGTSLLLAQTTRPRSGGLMNRSSSPVMPTSTRSTIRLPAQSQYGAWPNRYHAWCDRAWYRREKNYYQSLRCQQRTPRNLDWM